MSPHSHAVTPGETASDRGESPEAQQPLRHRVTASEIERLFGGASESQASPAWAFNDAAIAHLEKILGVSMLPKNAEEGSRLREAIDREISGLTAYLEVIKDFRTRDGGKGVQPDGSVSKLDAQFTPHVLAMETMRHPDLDSEVFDSPQSFVDQLHMHLRDGTPLARRLLVGGKGDEVDIVHYAPIDVVIDKGMISLIEVEAAPLPAAAVHGFRFMTVFDQALRQLEHPYRWSYGSNNIQNSDRGCIPYGWSYVKKFRDEKPFMDELHRKQIAGEVLHKSGESEEIYADLVANLKARFKNLHEIIVLGEEFMPLRFLIHSQTLGAVDAREKARPEDAAIPVKKPKADREAQTLREYVKSYLPPEGEGRKKKSSLKLLRYSLSMEKKRQKTAELTRNLFLHLREKYANLQFA